MSCFGPQSIVSYHFGPSVCDNDADNEIEDRDEADSDSRDSDSEIDDADDDYLFKKCVGLM